MEATFAEEEKQPSSEIFYPESDGQPMADNTKQFQWITKIQGSLDTIFENQADVFVAGDLLWYPVEGNNKIRVAPDVMVAFGRPKGHRGSYLQWKEDNIPPQVVFEILSPGNTASEMLKNKIFTLNMELRNTIFMTLTTIFLLLIKEMISFWKFKLLTQPGTALC